MNSIFSNGPAGDYVTNPFDRLLAKASSAQLAAPYFTLAEPVQKAALAGKPIQLLVGLNAATSPAALEKVYGVPGLAVRYLTHRFHAKIYIFDDAALLGSSNLTDGGLRSNREATICLDQDADAHAVEEIKALFLDLWDSAHVLTETALAAFKDACKLIPKGPDIDSVIEDAVGRAEPANISVSSRTTSRERLFLEGLRRQVYEQYRASFLEVSRLLEENDLRRPDLADVGLPNETNRFLNWVRLTHAPGENAWRDALQLPAGGRQAKILQLATEWVGAEDNRVPEVYVEWLQNVQTVFGSEAALSAATQEAITTGLMSLHAFTEQLRFTKGGLVNLPPTFWRANKGDVDRVRRSLGQFLYGPGDFIQRLHDLLYAPSEKLSYFGQFCALELYGTVKPAECPPMNGRMAKALKFLGFDVKGN